VGRGTKYIGNEIGGKIMCNYFLIIFIKLNNKIVRRFLMKRHGNL